MDSFETVISSIVSVFHSEEDRIPTDFEDGNGGGGAYCVVSHSEEDRLPVDYEDGNGGGGAYCVIA